MSASQAQRLSPQQTEGRAKTVFADMMKQLQRDKQALSRLDKSDSERVE